MKERLLEEIVKELESRDRSATSTFDKEKTVTDWVAHICHSICSAAFRGTVLGQRSELLRTAALVIAALENLDKNGEFPSR